MPRVFVIEQPRIRFSQEKVEAFGTVVILFSDDDRRPSLFSPDEFADAVVEQLLKESFRPDEDCICVTGSMIAVSLLLMTVVSRWGRARLLMFNARSDGYVLKTFSGLVPTGDRT